MRGQRKNPRKAVQPFENKKRKIDIFKNYEANGVEKIQRKLEIFSTLISKKSNHEEPVTQGGTYEEALAMAADWLLSVATIAKEKQEELPQPSQAKNEEVLIEMPQSADFKPALIRS